MSIPTLVVNGARLDALELILSGLIGPVDGYRLAGESPDGWPVVPQLRVAREVADAAGSAGALELRDTENTPLALLRDVRVDSSDRDVVGLAGTLARLRMPEHGVARRHRLTRPRELAGRSVALFSGGVHPADILEVRRVFEGRPIALVVEGTLDDVESARQIKLLEECVPLLTDARVYFVPFIDLGDEEGRDTTSIVLERAGAEGFRDFRRTETEPDGGGVVLLTGLSGAGKSTIARSLADELRTTSRRRVVLLDGDHVRAELASELGFSAADRDVNLRRQAWVGARVAEAGGIAICAPIAPFASSRHAMRSKIEPEYLFVLVHVSTPLAVAEQRDRKGLYAKARAGLIKDFTGIDSPYEVPTDADLTIDSSVLSVEECVQAIIGLLEERRLIV